MRFKRESPKTLISAVGDIEVARHYYYCGRCRAGVVPMDAWAGLDSAHLTPLGRQLVVLAGSDMSFDKASDRLHRLCGLGVSDQTVRRTCESSGEAARTYLQSWQAVHPVQQARGQSECTMDGAKVNTTAGWREIRGMVLCKREAGKPADLRHWDDRCLPAPSACWSWASVTDAHAIGTQLRQVADRLALGRGKHVSAVADGAGWIWKQLCDHLPDHEGVLDVYHLLEHLHASGRALHGEGEAAQRWAEKQRAALFRQGAPRYLREDLLAIFKMHRRQDPKSEASQSLRSLFLYLWKHRGRLRYRDRLRRGLPIGSGQIEGFCKNTLNARLRKNSPRWRVANVDRMAALGCLHHSNQWDAFWKTAPKPPA